MVIEPRDPASGKCAYAHIPILGWRCPHHSGKRCPGWRIADIRLLNLVEEHTISFLYDGETGDVELCDGFYNERLFDSPINSIRPPPDC